jgi:hypothetical protein
MKNFIHTWDEVLVRRVASRRGTTCHGTAALYDGRGAAHTMVARRDNVPQPIQSDGDLYLKCGQNLG